MGGGGSAPDCNSPALKWTPACKIADIIDPPTPPPDPPPPPSCDSYKVSASDEIALRNFNPNQNTPGRNCTNNLTTWISTSRNNFCNKLQNFTKNPGGDAGNCRERNKGKTLAREFCAQGNNIKTSSACTREYLGDDTYVALATTYCRSENGKRDPWCSCFNVLNGVCDEDSNASGCAEKMLNYDPLVASTPEGFRTEWVGREACYGLVCQESESGSKYIPENANQKCDSPIQICGQTFENVSNITESSIDAKCYIGGKEVDENGMPVNPTLGEEVQVYLPEGIREYIPISLDDLANGDSKKIAGSVGLSMICCCIIMILFLMMQGSSGGMPRRFRR
tara:strand:- start:1407 stop:2417 length:1011 start_codon:yes stop_codon:yes gene_type:complete